MSSNWQATTTKPITTILCYYTNSSSKMQLIRVTDSRNLNLEKIVFPQQRILFETIYEGQLEIYTSQAGTARLVQIIPCQNLQVNPIRERLTVAENISVQKNQSA